MASIATVAKDFGSKLESGSFDLSTLNPMQLGQQLMGSMSPEDMEQFTASLMEDGGDNIKSMMSGMLKNISSMPGLQEMAGGQDIAEMMKKMMESSGLPPMD